MSVHMGNTDIGVCSDIGNTNTSIHPVSYCPIWDEAVLIPDLSLSIKSARLQGYLGFRKTATTSRERHDAAFGWYKINFSNSDRGLVQNQFHWLTALQK